MCNFNLIYLFVFQESNAMIRKYFVIKVYVIFKDLYFNAITHYTKSLKFKYIELHFKCFIFTLYISSYCFHI